MTVDLDVLAGQVAAEQRGRERLLLAGAQAAEGLVDAVEHVAGPDLVGVAADLAALDGLAVAGGLEVDGGDVAVLRGTLDVLEGGEALAQGLDLLVDVVVGDGHVVDLHAERVVRRDLDRRAARRPRR